MNKIVTLCVLCAICMTLASCATKSTFRTPNVPLVTYTSAFSGPEQQAVERSLFSVLREADIEPIPGGPRATTTISVTKNDYVQALKVVLDAVADGRLPNGKLYLAQPAFWHYDKKKKLHEYEWDETKITL